MTHPLIRLARRQQARALGHLGTIAPPPRASKRRATAPAPSLARPPVVDLRAAGADAVAFLAEQRQRVAVLDSLGASLLPLYVRRGGVR